MASPPGQPAPRLRIPSNLSPASDEDAAATLSPARGAEMRDFLQKRLQKNRAPPLVHSWDFYHDRQDRTASTNLSNASIRTVDPEGQEQDSYEARLEHLAVIHDVKQFWNVWNNFDLGKLALRDSVHLFHKGVKPVWEDPRNVRGGSWTFRVRKDIGSEFWRELSMMAIGEQLQAAVDDETRTTFRDDICGISLGVRFNSYLVQIWNRDGEHQAGIQRIFETVMENLAEELKPKEGSFYYKKHSEHAGFAVAPEQGKGRVGDGSDNSVSKGAE